uniref:Uncharacterized protein n=1 Tax=Anopheles minimus TaxID=112268 RepID=A0A182VSU1_9DIPT
MYLCMTLLIENHFLFQLVLDNLSPDVKWDALSTSVTETWHHSQLRSRVMPYDGKPPTNQ